MLELTQTQAKPTTWQQSKTMEALLTTKAEAGTGATLAKDKAKLKQVSQEFEAVFVQQLLEAMEATVDRSEESELGGGSSETTFRSMLYENMAKTTASSPAGSIGLAKHIYAQAEKLLPGYTAPEKTTTKTL